MQAYAEGFELMHKSKFPIELKEVAGALEPRLGRALLAVRARRARVRARRATTSRACKGHVVGLRRGPLDDHRRDRPRRADAGDHRLALRPLLLARRRRLHAPRARRAAQPVRRPRGRARTARLSHGRRTRSRSENPLVEGLERLPVPPTTLVIFGATGDLAHRKLLPALYNLAHEGALPERFKLIGVSRREKGHDDFREECARVDPRVLAPRRPTTRCSTALLGHVQYIAVDFDDPDGLRAARRRRSTSSTRRPASRSTASTTSRRRRSSSRSSSSSSRTPGLHRHEQADVRCVIEKPFGTDLAVGARAPGRRRRASSASARSSASTTTWARRPSRT